MVDGHTGCTTSVETGVRQGSPISPILFAIYISDILRVVETAVLGIQATSFADDSGFMIVAESISEVTTKLQKAGLTAVDWGEKNFLTFDLGKVEAILFDKTLRRRKESRQQMYPAKIDLKGNSIRYNTEATRWLGIWLDSALMFREHKDVYL